MGLTGGENLSEIRSVVLALPGLMSQASTDAADELYDIVDRQFGMGIDPYGESWAPLSESTLRKGRTPPPLTDTGALGAAHIAPLPGAGVIVEFDSEYASFHQDGTSRMPARKLVPDPETFASSSWYDAVVIAYSNAILKNGGWRAAGADTVDEVAPMSNAAE